MLTRELSGQLQREHGLTLNDYEALLVLARSDDGHMRRVDLAEALLLTPSGVTRLLDGLERAGHVEKATCSTDARVTYAVITPEGRDKLEAASRSHLRAVAKLLDERFTRKELETLAELLGRLPGVGAGSADECAP
jgi:DNA-binding MarR family transcriptional regulator